MKLYRVWADEFSYDEYDSFIVSANSEEEAKTLARLLPCYPNEMHVKCVGEYYKDVSEIVHESFNAG